MKFLKHSIGKMIQVERGGPDKINGKLVAIGNDFITVETQQDGYIYLQTRHMKSISEPIVDETEAKQNVIVEENHIPPMIEADDFSQLLNQLKHRLIRINHAGPNVIQGVLIDTGDESITLLHQMKELVYFPTYHIRSVSCIFKSQDDNKKDDREIENKKTK